MTVGLDATYSVGRALSGVGVYSREILEGLARLHPEALYLHLYRPHRLFREGQVERSANCRRRPLLDGVGWPRPDLFHGLNQRMPRRPFRRSVCTFHDLFVLTADYSTPEFRERFAAQARDAAARADLVVAVSGFTADQVESLLHVPRSRLRVVHHGVRVRRQAPNARPREPLVLHVGAVQRRKNVGRLVEAFERMPPDWQLVLAGSAGYGAEEILERIRRSSRAPDITVTGYVDDAALEGWYARASVLAFPSLDEGFGMPVLEAMARGVPVVTSNRSALPEVSAGAALLVDPNRTDSIAEALCRFAESGELRAEFAERGLRRAAGATWERAVEETWAVYRELLG